MDFIGSFFNFDMSVELPSNSNLSTTTLISRLNSHVEMTSVNATISEPCPDDSDKSQSAL